MSYFAAPARSCSFRSAPPGKQAGMVPSLPACPDSSLMSQRQQQRRLQPPSATSCTGTLLPLQQRRSHASDVCEGLAQPTRLFTAGAASSSRPLQHSRKDLSLRAQAGPGSPAPPPRGGPSPSRGPLPTAAAAATVTRGEALLTFTYGVPQANFDSQLTASPDPKPDHASLSGNKKSNRSSSGRKGGSDEDEDEPIWFFAYGSKLLRESLVDCDVKVMSREPATVCDPNVSMLFRHRGGAATLWRQRDGDPAPLFTPPGAKVHGVLYRMSSSELKKLCKSNPGYELMEVQVQAYEAGEAVRSWVFASSQMSMLPSEVVPTEAYMRQLRDGAADQFLDPDYQAWLSSIQTVPSAGLPLEYWNTPSKHMAYAFGLLSVAMVAVAFFSQHS